MDRLRFDSFFDLVPTQNRAPLPLLLGLVLFLASGVSGPLWAGDFSNQECLACHGDVAGMQGNSEGLVVDESGFATGPHEGIACVDCHASISSLPHEKKLEPVGCGDCHSDSLEEVSGSIHRDSEGGEADASHSCVGCHGSHRIEGMEGRNIKESGEKVVRMCLQCHGEMKDRHGVEDRKFSTGLHYLTGVHFKELQKGNPKAPTCVDCHGSHGILPRMNSDSKTNPAHTTQTCGKCHEEAAHTFTESVHGQSLLLGYREAPECTSCHKAHDILPATDEAALTSPRQVSELCSSCHSSPVVAGKYANLSTDQPKTFFESIHGLSGEMGNTEAAHCASCHGVHNIFAPTDFRSTVHPLRVLHTCQECHPKAGPKFVEGKIHVTPTSSTGAILGSVRTLYMLLIAGTLGFMVLHNGLVIFRHVADRMKTHQTVATVKRFKRIHLVQHHLIALAFVLLVVTGFALKYPTSDFTRLLTFLGMTETIRATIHRCAALAAITLFVLHLFGLFCTSGGRKELGSLAMRGKDLGDFVGNVSYNLGKKTVPPSYDRYTYWEKFEYWALLWGMVIMTVTGCSLWFPEFATRFVPRWMVSVAEAVHFYEAVLASGAILFWHLFFAVYHPKEYPLSTSILTGEVTEAHMKEVHAIEYDRMKEEQMKNLENHPGGRFHRPQET